MLIRAVLLLLVCMNVGVASWWLAHREPVRAVLPATDNGVSSLTLLSEVERAPAPAPDAEELSSAPEVLSPGAVCLSLGPFQTPADLRRAMNLLMPRVERIQFRETAAVAVRGYKVFLPPAANRAQALQAARALSAQGVSDYYVVTAGDQQNTISLGIFRELENATKRHDAVAALGYNPSVEPRTEQTRQWWIDLAAGPGFTWQELLPGIGIKSSPVPCS